MYKSISFPWESKYVAWKGNVGGRGKDIGNSDVIEFISPSSFPFLFIIREPNKARGDAVEFRSEVCHKDACLGHVDYVVFLVLSCAAFHPHVSTFTEM